MPSSDARNPAEKWKKPGLILFLAGLALLILLGRLDQSAQSKENRAVNKVRAELKTIEGELSRLDQALLEKLAATHAGAAKLLLREKEEMESLASEESRVFGPWQAVTSDDQQRYREAQAVQQKIRFAQADIEARRRSFLDKLGPAAEAMSPGRGARADRLKRLREEFLRLEQAPQPWHLRALGYLSLAAILSGLALLVVWLLRRSR